MSELENYFSANIFTSTEQVGLNIAKKIICDFFNEAIHFKITHYMYMYTCMQVRRHRGGHFPGQGAIAPPPYDFFSPSFFACQLSRVGVTPPPPPSLSDFFFFQGWWKKFGLAQQQRDILHPPPPPRANTLGAAPACI